ncbi:MAG: hypothetical protein ABIB79_01765 [archaeon]
MGWFSNKDEVKKEAVPALPELPKLPELPRLEDDDKPEELHRLPSFPSNTYGKKFSQNAIKEAVTGEKEGEEEDEADDFATDDEMQMMRKPLKKSMTRELERGEPEESYSEELPETKAIKKVGPVFIRIDDFEHSLHIFEKARKDILEIEKMLKDIKKIKDEEGRELSRWEAEILRVKGQIAKVDEDIFSKIE